MAQPTTWRSRGFRRWRRHAVPLVVWLAAIGGAGRLITQRASICDMTGIARPEQREIIALTDGRLRLLPVELLGQVREGQTVAVLEDQLLQASLATAGAEATRLQAELTATEQKLTVEAAAQQTDYLTEARRYAIDVERNRLHEAEVQLTIKTDQVKLEYRKVERDLLADLERQHAVSELRSKEANTDCMAMEKTIEENQKVLERVRLDLQEARERQEAFAKGHVGPQAIDKALEPLRAAVTVQERAIDELEMRRAMLVLTSPVAGVVTQVLRGPGEAVRSGEPIMTIVAERPSSVIAYVPAAQAVQLDPGSVVRLEIARENGIRKSARTHIEAIGPVAEKTPTQLWRNPTIPEWGWPVKIAIPPDLGILCGEVIGVSKR